MATMRQATLKHDIRQRGLASKGGFGSGQAILPLHLGTTGRQAISWDFESVTNGRKALAIVLGLMVHLGIDAATMQG
jgi:hypothetical protein